MNLNECSQRGAVWGSGIARINSTCRVQGRAELGNRESGDSVDVAFYRSAPDTDGEVPDSALVVPDTDGKVPDSGRVVPDTGVKVPDSVAVLPRLCVSI